MFGEFGLGDIVAHVKANISDFQGKMATVKKEAGSSGLSLGALATGAAVAAGAFIAIKKSVDFVDSSLKAFGENQVAVAQLNQVLKTTGKNASITSKSVEDLAMQMENYSGQSHVAIEQGQTLLLQFAQTTKQNLPEMTKAMVDLAQRMGVDSVTAAKQLGIALDNPTTGMGRLRRSGIDFTEAQTEAIKAMQKSGDMAGADALLMQGLETKVGGAAGAFRNTLPGAIAAAKNKLLDFKETFGGFLVNTAAPEIIKETIKTIKDLSEIFDKYLRPSLDNFVHVFETQLLPALEKLYQQLKPVLIPLMKLWGKLMGAEIIFGLKLLIEGLTILVEMITAVANAYTRAIKDIERGASNIKQIFKMLKDFFTGGDATVSQDRISKPWREFARTLDAVQAIVIRVFTDIPKAWRETVKDIKQWIDDLGRYFMHLPEEIGFAIGRILKLEIEFVVGFITELIRLPGQIEDIFKDIWKRVATWFTKTKDDSTKSASDTISGIGYWFSQLPGNIEGWIKNTWASAKRAFDDFKNNAGNWAKDTVSSVGSWFYQLPGKMWDAIKGLASSAKKWFTDIGSSMWDGFKKGLGIKSPSFIEKAMMKIVDTGKSSLETLQGHMAQFNGFAAQLGQAGGLATATSNTSNMVQTNVNGPITIGSQNDADYFFKRLTRGQELAKLGIPVPPGGLG